MSLLPKPYLCTRCGERFDGNHICMGPTNEGPPIAFPVDATGEAAIVRAALEDRDRRIAELEAKVARLQKLVPDQGEELTRIVFDAEVLHVSKERWLYYGDEAVLNDENAELADLEREALRDVPPGPCVAKLILERKP